MAELKYSLILTSDKKVGEQEFDHIFQIEVPLVVLPEIFQHVLPAGEHFY